MRKAKEDAILAQGRRVLAAEIAALQAIRQRLDQRFSVVVSRLASCRGRIATCGMGKAGIIAQKIAATLSSTGTSAFFLHPADALHGDLGMLRKGDAVLVLSNSGESEEIVRLLPTLRRLGVIIIAITASLRSTLAAQADQALLLGEIPEACPLGLAPTATTTAMLALGDAIAICLMKRKRFAVRDYARLHPGGTLGRKARPVEDVMRVGEAVALARPQERVQDVIIAITSARAGAAMVVDSKRRLLGIFCDGDLRRGLESDPKFLQRRMAEVMITSYTRVTAGTRVSEVLEIMKEKRIAEVPVVDGRGRLLGVADLKGLVASL